MQTDTTNKRRRHSTDPSPSTANTSDKPLKKRLLFDLDLSDTNIMPGDELKTSIESHSEKPKSIITDDDVQRIAHAVKDLIFDDLRKELRTDMQMCITQVTVPLYAEIEKLKYENSQLKNSCSEIPKINSKIDDLEQHSRKSCIRIYGVPESNEENTTDIVCDIARKLNVTLENKDISVSHRLPSDKGPKSIIARFTHTDKRHELLRATKNIPTTPDLKGIGITQDLTKNRSKVAYLARQAAKQRKIKSTSVWDGKIFITDNDGNRKIITNESELNSITNDRNEPISVDPTSRPSASPFPSNPGMMQFRSPGSPMMYRCRMPFMSLPPQNMFSPAATGMVGPPMVPQMSFTSS